MESTDVPIEQTLIGLMFLIECHEGLSAVEQEVMICILSKQVARSFRGVDMHYQYPTL